MTVGVKSLGVMFSLLADLMEEDGTLREPLTGYISAMYFLSDVLFKLTRNLFAER